MSKKYYWIKLEKDFFKRHIVKVIEDMDNGKDYLLFYLKLLVESVSHEGHLRFSDTIPYNEKMLSSITNTNVDIVRSAVKLFIELKLMEKLDDETIYLTEVKNIMDSITEVAIKKREYRKKLDIVQMCPTNVQQMSNNVIKNGTLYTNSKDNININKDKEKDNINIISKEKEKTTYFKKPTTIEIEDYFRERSLAGGTLNFNIKDEAEKFFDFYESKNWVVGKAKMSCYKATIRNWLRNVKKTGISTDNKLTYGNQKMLERLKLNENRGLQNCNG